MAGIDPNGKPAMGQRQAHWHWPAESRLPEPETTFVAAAAAAAAAGAVVTVRMGGTAMVPIAFANVAVSLGWRSVGSPFASRRNTYVQGEATMVVVGLCATDR